MRKNHGQKQKLARLLTVPLVALQDKWEGIFVSVISITLGTLLL